jgi:AmmeMemoRadiSam system radical SAM enzyme/AmmeMemoRadiSam system protein B/AmmeMemoRadiSam system protein A
VLTTYGRSTGFCIDPIEKKPLNQFFPGTAVLSFGTGGCNLGCKFCQNWTTTKSRETDIWCEAASPEAIAEAARAHGCTSVAFTYNEPIIWAEYAIDTARACRAVGIRTVAVTNGYITAEARQAFFEVMDAANVDLKAFTEEFYRKYCAGHLQPVLETLKWLVHHSTVWVEITNLIIPEANDSPTEIRQMCRWIRDELRPDVPIHFTAFHPDFQLLDRPPTPARTLRMAYEIAREEGLLYVYTGNILDVRTQSTYCPSCGKVVIERCGFQVSVYALRGNRCSYCGAEIAGRYGPAVGSWGSRRLSIRIPPVGHSARRNAPAVPPSTDDPPPQPSAANRQKHPDRSGATSAAAGEASASLSTNPGSEAMSENHSSPRQEACPSGDEATRTGHQSSTAGQSEAGPAVVPERPLLTNEEESKILRLAAERVVAAVCGGALPSAAPQLGSTAQKPLFGIFVSLKRHGQLRSCCGALGEPIPLALALDQASYRAAKEDFRFPPISPAELKYLDIEVWLLWNYRPMMARGLQRVQGIEIGKHGLQVVRGANRGLLLPAVAVEHALDAQSFLEHTCLKAGLPADAWKSDDVQVFTFEGYALHGRLSDLIPELPEDTTLPGPTDGELDALISLVRHNLNALSMGATPTFFIPGIFDGQVCGVLLWASLPGWTEPVREARLSLRPELPLQSTLYDLTQGLVRALSARQWLPGQIANLKVDLAVLWDVLPHGALGNPDWSGFRPDRRAIMVVAEGGWAIGWNPDQAPEELAGQLAEALTPRRRQQAALFSFRLVSSLRPWKFVRLPARQIQVTVRPPAVAGRFYPADGEAIATQLSRWATEPVSADRWAAALVPHAGWIYSGKVAFQTLQRVQIPPWVLVFATKHRPEGASWALAPYERWQLPDGFVEGDPAIARQLAESVEGLELDAAPHAQEHAIEVILPMLRFLQPAVRVVGLVMRGGELEELEEFAQQMAEALRTLPCLPLIVISTDMSHYIPESEARRLDKLAIEAMERCDPAELFHVVRQKQISMCGLTPTVAALLTLRHLGQLSECYRVAYTTSAEVSGDRNAVVGYVGLLFR